MSPTDNDLFTAGDQNGLIPIGDAARQAVDSLRGYAYQLTAAALAWLDLDEKGRLFLEVAEDYATVLKNALTAVQVKDTEASGTITLNTASVKDAIASFVHLYTNNPTSDVHLHYLTTSEIGIEKATADRPDGDAALDYWRKAARGADVGPLRAVLESAKFPSAVQEFVRQRDDETLRKDLLRKIHWDGAAPDLSLLRRELEDRVVVIGRDRSDLPATEAQGVANVLVQRAFERSVAKNPADRALTRADLYRAIDEVALVSVPRATLRALTSALAVKSGASQNESATVTSTGPVWIIEASTLPASARTIRRRAVENNVAARLRTNGVAILVGASGLGKSTVMRAIAGEAPHDYAIVDFRGADTEQTRSRIDALVARIGGLRARTIVFEDLNDLDDPALAISIRRVFEAMRRRDITAIITCYAHPANKALENLEADVSCTLPCPYFTKEDTEELVALYGGDAKIWGPLAYAAAGGHPQLVHAFIAGVRARGWKQEEVSTLIRQGLSSEDIVAERDATRRGLIAALPENVRSILYRLSLTIGTFDRQTALKIAATPPPIPHAGECMDALIGPWLEPAGSGRYRVSPLAISSGRDMLSHAEQAGIHYAIASQMMSARNIDAADIDAIVMHALLGKNVFAALKVAYAIVTLDERTSALVADNVIALKVFGFDSPLFPMNSVASGMLRMAQFKLLIHSRDPKRIAACAAALVSEMENLPSPIKEASLALGLMSVVGTMGIANYVPNWLVLLGQLQELTERDEFLSNLRRNYESKPDMGDMFGALFGIGSSGIASVALLERVIEQLDGLDSTRRSVYLSGVAENLADFSVFIHGAWSREHLRNAVNANEARERFRRMAMITARWGIRALTLQCWIAQAIMLDEYAQDREGAFGVLHAAVLAFGDDILLSRARAKIYWRAQDYENALRIMREIADQIGRDNPIERAFALREAAISAAKSNDWKQGEAWFLEAKEAALRSIAPDMAIMAIGLGADAGVAALQAGRVDHAIGYWHTALQELSTVDPSAPLRAAYCHRVVRHTLMWALRLLDGRTMEVNGAPLTIVPGGCSNVDPPKEIAQHPCGPLDIAWYVLAHLAIVSGVADDLADTFYASLTGGQILVLEYDLRARRVIRDMARLHAVDFSKHLWAFIEAAVYLAKEGSKFGSDPLNPSRGEIPSLPRTTQDARARASGADSILAFIITAVCTSSLHALKELAAALEAEFGQDHPWAALMLRLQSLTPTVTATSFDDALIDSARRFGGKHQTPQSITSAAIRFYQHAIRSNVKSHLFSVIAGWVSAEWARIIDVESFRLTNPGRTVPVVRAALEMTTNDERFVAGVLLAAVDATGVSVYIELREQLKKSAGAPSA